jgi:hypothetical protein
MYLPLNIGHIGCSIFPSTQVPSVLHFAYSYMPLQFCSYIVLHHTKYLSLKIGPYQVPLLKCYTCCVYSLPVLLQNRQNSKSVLNCNLETVQNPIVYKTKKYRQCSYEQFSHHVSFTLISTTDNSKQTFFRNSTRKFVQNVQLCTYQSTRITDALRKCLSYYKVSMIKLQTKHFFLHIY